ncbi:hypothetical protein [Sorangium cellulosum]|uniref:hypothetical protein n=1 Tax=Sorangium cellulosum TaxID=56 RepID=UPI001010A504|nr:hypothetical protein [Sorangium cellulosum]
MITKRAALCLGLAAAVALAAAPARAQEGPPATSGSRRAPVVELVLTGDADHLDVIRTALESEALSAFTVRVRTAPRFDAAALLSTRASSGVTLSCWIDLSDPRRAALYFTDPVADRFLLRSIELSGRFDELDRESVAQVVELSLRSLREGARSSLDRAQASALLLRDAGPEEGAAPRARPTRDPVPASGSRRALELGVFYGVMAHSDELGWAHGPGLRVGLGGGSRSAPASSTRSSAATRSRAWASTSARSRSAPTPPGCSRSVRARRRPNSARGSGRGSTA